MRENISLKPYNTFGIDVQARAFVSVTEASQLKEILEKNTLPVLILGGGSNILLTRDFDGLVIKNDIRGIELVDEDDDSLVLKVGAGEVWHDFVMYCIEKGYCGLENLSLIPGCVGASPMQNIGAYGVEVKDVIREVEVMDLADFSKKTFSNEACEFGYRSSIFKTWAKGKYFITAVSFRLTKKPNLNTSYGAIDSELHAMGIQQPTIKDVSTAVIRIRQSKLPDPKEIGNSGSFFKNPVVEQVVLDQVLQCDPDAPNYPQPDGTFKLAAGWLIEKCGWKGKLLGNYGVHDKQALVLVNHGGANGKDIFELSEAIITSVQEKFGVTLEREVNIL
ncbi:MAG: UDP-N-acetylmuramate dehydrogenase [Flavobacteriales bacterium]|nr:UDP-N-acetylmuramate dehydrogenase [Flavobacteriales bacterium]